MNNYLQFLILVISIVSIIFSIVAIYHGQSFIDASGGFLIAICLLGVLFVEKKNKKS